MMLLYLLSGLVVLPFALASFCYRAYGKMIFPFAKDAYDEGFFDHPFIFLALAIFPMVNLLAAIVLVLGTFAFGALEISTHVNQRIDSRYKNTEE